MLSPGHVCLLFKAKSFQNISGRLSWELWDKGDANSSLRQTTTTICLGLAKRQICTSLSQPHPAQIRKLSAFPALGLESDAGREQRVSLLSLLFWPAISFLKAFDTLKTCHECVCARAHIGTLSNFCYPFNT